MNFSRLKSPVAMKVSRKVVRKVPIRNGSQHKSAPEHRALTKLIQRHMALGGIFIIRNAIMAHLCLVDTNVDRHSTRATLGAPALFVRPSFVILAQDVKCASLRNLRMTKWLIETRKGTRSFGRLTASINLTCSNEEECATRSPIACPVCTTRTKRTPGSGHGTTSLNGFISRPHVRT